ncbi:MAG: pantoate--beta-alanine ligase [Chloroflexi bacterium]|nr:MAG: pantoate--beta-alanine ligase [Chloroflexota bacterium]
MVVCETIADLRAARANLPAPVGFVPTMGYLHAGHMALVHRARQENASTVVSIFVNPIQFDRAEDLARYPRDLPRDMRLLEEAGVDLVFAPSVEEMYPAGFRTVVHVREITEVLEGKHRPGHFDGVTTVVTKLLNIVQPDRAYFGQKDAQQAIVVKQLVADLNIPVEIREVATVREPDGLALSSRNVLLSPAGRAVAPTLYQALQAAQAAWQEGERDADRLRAIVHGELAREPRIEVEYVSLADLETLQELKGEVRRGLLSLAAWIDGVRLIDNVRLEGIQETT